MSESHGESQPVPNNAESPTVHFAKMDVRSLGDVLTSKDTLSDIESIGPYLVHGDHRESIRHGTAGWVLPGLRPDGGRAMVKLSKVPTALSRSHYEDAFNAQLEAHARTPFVPMPFDWGSALIPYIDPHGAEQKDYFSYIGMEYIDGKDLHSHINAGDLDEETKLQIILTTAHGVDAMLPLISTDLKPENILIRRDNHRPIIIDLETAVDEKNNINGEEFSGTVQYLAFEQLIQDKQITRALNVHQLGAIAYEMFTGERYMNIGEDIEQDEQYKMVADILRDPDKNATFLKNRLLHPKLPEHARGVFAKALAQQPEDRYQTAAEFATALRKTVRTHGKAKSHYTRRSTEPRNA